MEIETEEQYKKAIGRIAEIHILSNNRAYSHSVYGAELDHLVNQTYIYEENKYLALGPMLKRLRDERVFEITISDKSVDFLEKCDECFGTTLTKTELMQLVGEIKAIADRLSD